MLRFRDLSLRKRLLLANFMMVAVPVLLLSLVGGILLSAFRYSGTTQKDILTALWPEKGSALTVQYAVSSLRVRAERKGKPRVKDYLEPAHLLEAQGIAVIVSDRNGSVYYTSPGADRQAIAARILSKYGPNPSLMNWDHDGFDFSYVSPRSGTIVMAAGDTPFLAKNTIPGNDWKDRAEHLLYISLIMAVTLIVFFGLYLSRLLSRQILTPLDQLRKAAADIRAGNLDTPVSIDGVDEFGSACRDFELMRQELRRVRLERERYEENRKELIAGISHDLSTPLTSIKGYAGGILDGIADTDEKKLHYIKQIQKSTDTLESLVNNLFLLSKLDLGRLPFHLEKVDLIAYFKDFTTEQSPLYKDRGLDLSMVYTDKKPAFAFIDRIHFERVVRNILNNALKYNDKDRCEVMIQIKVQKNSVCVTFSDNGPGVASGELTKLFNTFYRTDKARTDVTKGSGLGLAITAQIIKTLGGTVRAAQASQCGGLMIVVTLPIAEGDTYETHPTH